MNKKKRNVIISTSLILLAVIFTILVKVIDVQAVGVNGSDIGFATLNQFVFEKIGVNMIWYDITTWLGIIPIIVAMVYALIGVIQLIKRKSIYKVDREIMVLGAFYVVVVCTYVFFEKVIVNYRPILMDGLMEASYPSSHTFATICLCGSFVIINKKLFDNKFTKLVNVLAVIIAVVTVVGRLMSGVHWFTDIIGGLIISMALLMALNTVMNLVKEKRTEI